MVELSARVNAQCEREARSEDGFGAQIRAAADRGDPTYQPTHLVVCSLLTVGVDTAGRVVPGHPEILGITHR